MDKGIYCLVLENTDCSLNVGALGMLNFSGGWHVYVGSATGPGGFVRVVRHIRYSQDPTHAPRWHIDYILSHHAFFLVSVLCAPAECEMECRLAGMIPAPSVPGFGCSDCICRSHLFTFQYRPEQDLARAFEHLGLDVTIKKIKKS